MPALRAAIMAAFIVVGIGLLGLAAYTATAGQAPVTGLVVGAMGIICIGIPYLMVRGWH